MTFIGHKAFSQVSLSYYNSSESKIGLAYNFSDKIWGEARVAANFDKFKTDVVLCYNAIEVNNYNFYLGLGVQLNDDQNIVMPIGVHFSPFEKFKELALNVEFQPIFTDGDQMLQSSIGIRYTFGKK